MFIRKMKKQHQHDGSVSEYYFLTKSVRTPRGPRQEFILNLGCIDLTEEQRRSLAKRIEETLEGLDTHECRDPYVESLAREFVARIKQAGTKSEAATGP